MVGRSQEYHVNGLIIAFSSNEFPLVADALIIHLPVEPVHDEAIA